MKNEKDERTRRNEGKKLDSKTNNPPILRACRDPQSDGRKMRG
jgi:hypothetical protein